jgi:hypothetical protein
LSSRQAGLVDHNARSSVLVHSLRCGERPPNNGLHQTINRGLASRRMSAYLAPSSSENACDQRGRTLRRGARFLAAETEGR